MTFATLSTGRAGLSGNDDAHVQYRWILIDETVFRGCGGVDLIVERGIDVIGAG